MFSELCSSLVDFLLMLKPIKYVTTFFSETVCAYFLDSKKQQLMATLTREKDQLSKSIDLYKKMFDTTNQLIAEIKCKFSQICK